MIQEFIRNIEHELEIRAGTLTPETKLNTMPQMDSMGTLTLMLMIDTTYGFTIEPEQMSACETVRDLYEYVMSRKQK